MMNRSVMKRQMFNRGGAASFPDLSGDGKVTRKDVLMGRGVQGLAMGGPPMMDPNMMPPAAPPQMGPEQALAGAEAQGQEMGMMAAEGVMQQIDGAQDYQSLIDGIRGNQQPLEARYAELGGIVGEQDAMQTPESVLALTQPAIMMTEEGAVNSGIGELMQGIAGDTSMAGQMGEGVGGLMMAQAPEPAMEAPMMEAGNTPPVNFRQGGPVEVRGYRGGDEAKVGNGQAINRMTAGNDLAPYLKQAQEARASILGTPEERASILEEMKRANQSQALFDLAGTFLDFAGNTEGGSFGARLANSATRTGLTDKIGARAAALQQGKQTQLMEDRQMALSALESAEAQAESARGRNLQEIMQQGEFANQIAMQATEIDLKRDLSKDSLQNALDLADKAYTLQKYVTDTSTGASLEMNNANILSAEKLAQAKNDLTEMLANQEIDFKQLEGMQDRAAAEKLLGLKNANALALTTLQGELTSDQIKLKGKIEKNLRYVDEAISKRSAQEAFKNRIAEMGVSQGFTLETLAKQQEYSSANIATGFKNRLREISTIEGVDTRAVATAFNNRLVEIDINAENSRQSVEQALENAIKVSGIENAQVVAQMRLGLQQDLVKMGMGQEYTLEAQQQQAKFAAEAAKQAVTARLTELGINNTFISTEAGKKFLRDITLKDMDQENNRENLGIQLENALKLSGVSNAQTIAQMRQQLNMDLTKMGVAQEFSIETMGEQLSNSKDLALYTDGLATAAREDQQAFTAGQSALQRMLTRSEGRKGREAQFSLNEFNQEFQREMTQLGIDQQVIDRQVARVNQSIQNAFETDRLLQGDRQLNLQAARDAFDQHYKSASLYLEAEAAKVSPIASKGLDATLRFFSDPALIEAYSDGSLDTSDPEMKNLLEGLISNYARVETSVNALGETTTKPASALNTALQAAIQNRADNNLSVPVGSTLKVPPLDRTNLAPIYLDASEKLNLIEALDPETGRIDFNSPFWSEVDAIMIDPEAAKKAGVDFAEAQGLTGGITRLFTLVNEVANELKLGEPTEYQKGLKKIDRSLEGLVGGLRKFRNQDGEGRVLKFAQILDEKIIAPMLPKTWATDLNARAAAEGVFNDLGLKFQQGAEILRSGERGGEVGYSKAQLRTARKDMLNVANYMIELKSLMDAYDNTGSIREFDGAGASTDDRSNLKKVLQNISDANPVTSKD